MDSCLALSMKPQVLITTLLGSSFLDSCSTAMPLPRNCVSNTSESTWFLEQPRVTMLTLVFLFPFVFNGGAKLTKCQQLCAVDLSSYKQLLIKMVLQAS